MMKYRTVFVLLVFLLAACNDPRGARITPTPGSLTPAAPVRVEPLAAQTATSVWRIVGNIGDWNVDLSIYQQSGGVVETATPAPSATVPATATAAATLIPTIAPTRTTSSTSAPLPTVTPFATPTPPPTSTPGTSTPGPVGKTCEAAVAISRGINVRDVPDISGNRKTTLAQGTRVVVSGFWTAGGFLWAQVPALAGYMVVGEYGEEFAWWVTFSNNDFCTGLDTWPPELAPPPEIAHIAALIWHDVPGANIEEMKLAWAILRQAGYSFRG